MFKVFPSFYEKGNASDNAAIEDAVICKCGCGDQSADYKKGFDKGISENLPIG